MKQTLADRGNGEELQTWRCAFDRQLTTALQMMPLVGTIVHVHVHVLVYVCSEQYDTCVSSSIDGVSVMDPWDEYGKLVKKHVGF